MRRATMLLGVLALSGVVGAACAGSTGGAGKCTERPWGAGMSLEEAQAIVTELEQKHLKLDPDSPLHAPKSLDDVLEILKSDELDLFPAGVAFAAKQDGPEAKALAAQLELAWGEAELSLADLFSQVAASVEESVRSAELAGAANDELRARLSTNRGVADALTRLAAEHTADGARDAKAVIAAAPDNYQGYRVAADYYRMRERWTDFDATVQKLEQLKPDSNGLVFLRGVAALYREGDSRKADAFFRQALEKDPKFVRAQAQLLRSQQGLAAKYAEYQKLKALNPHHQIVVWAGPLLESAFAARAGQ